MKWAAAILVLLAAAAALTHALYRRDIQSARERISTGSRIADTRCGPIEFAVAGDGLPLLVVHGAGGGFDQGLEFAAPLASRGFRVISVSRFGYLRTPLPADASAAAQADAHACLLDELGIARVAVLGASAGAPSSLQLALRHPDRVAALVLVVPALYVPRAEDAPSIETPSGTAFLFDTALRSDFVLWAALRLARSTMIRAILATPPEVVERAGADERVRVDRMLAHILPVTPRRLGLLNDAEVTSSIERYALERVEAPSLLLSAADDLFGTFEAARYTAEQIPGALFVGYPSGGHVLVGRQQELMAEVERFVREQWAIAPDGGN
ncbi:MAG: alpha/beta hydrolase [Gammaproteobacteria bacterium]|nr:alpha/beta hydrolase [Gammaproteobacteria bacterium]